MIPPDRAIEEGSAKSNTDFKIGVGVLGLVSVCIAVFVIFLCAKKDRKSIRKKPSTESSQDLLENQVSPARHGISNIIYAVTENGIGERLLQNETSVEHQSLPTRGEGRSHHSSSESSHSLTSTQNNALTNQQQALYDSPTSNKPIQTKSTESQKNQTVCERSQSEDITHSLSSDENLVSSGGKRHDSADELYLVPKPNKSRNEKKPLQSPKLLEKPKKKRPDASDSVKDTLCELANTTCNYGTSTYPHPKLIKEVDLKKDNDTHAKPLTKKTQEQIIAFSSSREGKLSESESGIDENNSLYVYPKSNKSIDERKHPCKHGGNNKKEILDKSDNNFVSSTAMSIPPSSVERPRSPLQGSKTGEDIVKYQFTLGFSSTDTIYTPYDFPKSGSPSDHRKPFPLPKLEDGSDTKPMDGANVTMEPEMESKQPHARFNRPLNAHTTSNKGDILDQKSQLQSPLTSKINPQPVILSSSKYHGLSTTRTAPDENSSDSKKCASKEGNSTNNLHKSAPVKQIQNGQTKLKKKPELVSSRGHTIDDDESHNGRLSNASDINSSHISIEYDPSMYANVFSFPAEDLLPPPPPCQFSYGDIPKTMASKQNQSLTRYVDSEPEDHPDYTNCEGFSKRNNNLKLMETDCPPAPCCTHKYINVTPTPSKELEEDNEYVAMNTHDDLDLQSTFNSFAKYANIQDSRVRLTPESDKDMYLPMTKHLAHAISDTCLYQNGGNMKLKENKYIYVNSSFSTESTQKGLHESEQDDVYSYASTDFFLKNKMAADTAKRSDDYAHHSKAPKPAARSTSFQTTTSAKENFIKTQTAKPQKLHQKVFVSKTVVSGKPSLETIPPPRNTTYK
ncbi:hypothetical protein ACJMK2_017153 [Sinanodonta woodiana]|uniref:Uncharacterized protein n=1 Tax=Sinanodonta woodiana TaxID=1069815 RepID=A0ABD3UVY8_SINWO